MSTSNQMNVPAEILTEEEKDSIIRAAKDQCKDSIKMKSRRVEAVLVNGEIFLAKAPFFYGWVSGAAGHWGVVVDGLMHHLVFKVDEDRNPIGINFQGESFRQEWINEGKATKEEIGSTSLPLDAIKAVGETLILKFGNYKRLYRNAQTFADIFVQIICDVERKAFSPPSIQNVIANTLLAFPLTTIRGSIMHTDQKNFVKKVINKTNKANSWEDIVDAEINDEINKIGLDIVSSKSGCFLM